MAASPEGQSQLHKHHFWPWDVGPVYSFKHHLKDPFVQIVCDTCINRNAYSSGSWISSSPGLSEFLYSLRSEPSFYHLFIHLLTQEFLSRFVKLWIYLHTHLLSRFPWQDFFKVSFEGFPLGKRKMPLGLSRKERGYDDGWGQLQTAWHGLCCHHAQKRWLNFL